MARVFGMEVNSERLAKIAKQLLLAHLCILLFAVLGGALSIISNVVMRSAAEDLAESSGGVPADDANATARYIGDVLGRLFIPVTLLILARCALQSNDQCLMHCLCITDSVGVGVQCCGGITAIALLSTMAALKRWAQMEDCSNYGTSASSGNISKQDCLDTRDAAIAIFNLAYVMCIIVAILSFLLMAVCFWAANQANEGRNALLQGEVFVGKPVQAAPMTMVVGVPVVRQPEEKAAKV